MKKNILKVIFTFFGIAIFIDGVITEIDGIGRFAMILFATIFTLIGSFLK